VYLGIKSVALVYYVRATYFHPMHVENPTTRFESRASGAGGRSGSCILRISYIVLGTGRAACMYGIYPAPLIAWIRVSHQVIFITRDDGVVPAWAVALCLDLHLQSASLCHSLLRMCGMLALFAIICILSPRVECQWVSSLKFDAEFPWLPSFHDVNFATSASSKAKS
jgi:hypothetical protein